MWIEHWGLSRDPFAERDAAYVSTQTHDEAVARLVHGIETARRRLVFTAEAGLGKTRVLRQALAMARGPGRRVIAVTCPPGEGSVLAILADRLSDRPRRGSAVDRPAAWKVVERSIRAAAVEKTHIVVAIDDCHQIASHTATSDLALISHLGDSGPARLTIIQVGRPDQIRAVDRDESWMLSIGLERLTRSQAERYVATKLGSAGASGSVFTGRAITRLHALSAGLPRGIEQIAGLSLIAGALRGLETVTPDLVDGVATQLLTSPE